LSPKIPIVAIFAIKLKTRFTFARDLYNISFLEKLVGAWPALFGGPERYGFFMLRHELDGLAYYTFGILEGHPSLRHAVFSSSGPGGRPFNLSFSKGPKDEVLRNLDAARGVLGLPPVSLVNQAHGDRALVLKRREVYAPKSAEEQRGGYDALVGFPGQTLMVKLADCQGAILFHPPTLALAVVHSGWRGSVQNILGKTVAVLQKKRGAVPCEILACVSPSIGPCCMEFRDWETLLPGWAREYVRDGDHVDFWEMSKRQLLDAGLMEDNIEIASVCTKCTPGFYSHRRGDEGRFGVMAGVLP
jgi:YfiH family protein